MVEPAGQWYAVHTRSRHEEKVVGRLQRKQIDVFLPRVSRCSRRTDRRKLILVPMFPGYVFVNGHLSDDFWLKIVRTEGVASLVGYGRQPVNIPAEQMETLRIVDAAGPEAEPYPGFAGGDRVRVVSGPLQGVLGTLLYKHERGHCLVINVDGLNQGVIIHVDGSRVERAI